MKSLITGLGLVGLLAIGCTAFGAEHSQLKAFPKAKEGMERFVIVLPDKERAEENDFRVELVAGKEMLTDGVNQVRMDAVIKPQPLEGWGYTYYEVSGSGRTMSTLMAPPPGAEKANQFVKGEPLQIRYNSRLPIVVYAPKGFEIRYRIWSASGAFKKAEGG